MVLLLGWLVVLSVVESAAATREDLVRLRQAWASRICCHSRLAWAAVCRFIGRLVGEFLEEEQPQATRSTQNRIKRSEWHRGMAKRLQGLRDLSGIANERTKHQQAQKRRQNESSSTTKNESEAW